MHSITDRPALSRVLYGPPVSSADPRPMCYVIDEAGQRPGPVVPAHGARSG